MIGRFSAVDTLDMLASLTDALASRLTDAPAVLGRTPQRSSWPRLGSQLRGPRWCGDRVWSREATPMRAQSAGRS